MTATTTPAVEIHSCHHVALRCHDAQATVDFYTGLLGMRFVIATREHLYRGEACNYLHIFLEMKDGNYLSFFEVPGLPDQEHNPDAPGWVQHFALRVNNREEVEQAKTALQAHGVHVDGPVVREPFCSIYFADPSGNRMEVTAVDAMAGTRYAADEAGARRTLRAWQEDKRTGAADNTPTSRAL